MGWLIIRVEKKEAATWTRAERDAAGVSHVIDRIAARHALAPPQWRKMQEVGADHGYLLAPPLMDPRRDGEDWPYTAYVYTSRRKDG